jgi:DNA-binding CsgD family transcriptional regulator
MNDWIGIVEAGYDLSGDQGAWLDQVLTRAAPLMDRGVGVNAQIFRVSATRFALEDVAVRGIGTPAQLRAFIEQAPPPAIDMIYRHGLPAGSLSETMFPRAATLERRKTSGGQRYFVANAPADFQDSMGVLAHTGTGWGVVLAAPLQQPGGMGEGERRRWTRVAAHLAAGLRLRRLQGAAGDDADRVEAVLSPGGRVEHAARAAQSATARERLRAAALACDRARTVKHRGDVDTALELWEGLVHGRWSLVDRFDADGRRFIVAIRNAPELPDPRGLTPRERQVAEFCGMRRSTKDIAYILGMSSSAVGTALNLAARKLGLRSRTELAALFAPAGLRARLAEQQLLGEGLAVGSYPLADEGHFGPLSAAQRDVAVLLLQGGTYAEIAAQRGSAERTIANQAQAIYRKLAVRSRVEMAALLGAGGSGGA